jgi:fumarate hydratase class II
MPHIRKRTEGLGVVEFPADGLWGAQTQRSLEITVRRTVEK